MQLKKIETRIYEIRGQKIMLDFDLAELYEVPTKSLNLAVKRNLKRFPRDFMFRLKKSEWESLRFQIETSNGNKEENSDSKGRGGTRYLPFAFTEQGLAMLSGVLNSDKAIKANIAIMRAFVMMREFALTHKDLTNKLRELEIRFNKHFNDIYEAINYLLNKDKLDKAHKERKRIGFK